MRTEGRSLAAVAATMLVLAGCGSTVAGAGSTQAGSTVLPGVASPGATSGDGGLTVPGGVSTGPGGSGALPPGSTGGGVVAPGAGTGGTVPGTTPGGGPTSSGGRGPGSSSNGSGNGGGSGKVPAAAPGVTDDKIYIGIEYSSQAAAGNKALGAGDASASYDSRDVFNTALKYANDHGGFAGRQLEAIYYDINLSNDRASEDQAACQKFTQDNKVFAILAVTDILRSCAEKAGALGLFSGSATSQTYQRFPHLIDPVSIAFDRLGQVTVNGLASAHYFAGKVGLITWDDPTYRLTVQNGYLPALARNHVTLATDPVYVTVPQQFGELGATSAAVQNAVAKFSGLGIDHVLIQDGPAGIFAGDGITFEFMNQAKSQRYYPRYGGNTYINPGTNINPSDQQDKLLAVDELDISRENDAGIRLNQAREFCFKLMTQGGYPPKQSNDNDKAIASAACDLAFFVQTVVNRLPSVSVNGFLQQAATLGTSFKAAEVYGTNLFPGRRDGGDFVRVVEYLDSCKCLKYQGPPYQAG